MTIVAVVLALTFGAAVGWIARGARPARVLPYCVEWIEWDWPQ